MLRVAISALITSLLLTGCERRHREEREATEYRAAHLVFKCLQIHESQFPDRSRTNLAEIFKEVGVGYPYGLEGIFLEYGREAGFSNSFYEKYVFAPPGLSNRALRAEILLLNSEPFADSQGRLSRITVLRRGPGVTNWALDQLSEEQIQKCFSEAGLSIPKPLIMPPPPPGSVSTEAKPSYSSRDRIQILFRNLAEDLGLGRHHWWDAADWMWNLCDDPWSFAMSVVQRTGASIMSSPQIMQFYRESEKGKGSPISVSGQEAKRSPAASFFFS